jgi:hypothetical protein
MKGDYVKESELQEMTKTAKDIKKGDSFKANLKIPGKGVNIARAYSVVATDDAMDSKTHPGQRVSIHVKAGNYTTVVSYDKNHKLDISESTIEESSNDLGTATIVSPGHKYHGKAVRVFHKFDDGRINVQYKKSDKKGDLVNLTLNKGQYKLDEETIQEKMLGFSHPEVSRQMLDIIDEFDARDVEALLKHMIDSFTYPDNESSDIDLLVKNLKRTLHDWKNRSSN